MSSMLANRSGRFRIAATLCCAVGWAMGVMACAGTPTTEDSSLSLMETISKISADRDGNDTVVMLSGVYQPVFTAYAQTGPDRVIVDVVSVNVDAGVGTVAVNDGLVTEIQAESQTGATGEQTARIEIGLDAPAEYHVQPVTGGLEIRISGDHQNVAEAEAYDPWASNDSQDSETAAVAATDASDTDDAWASNADVTPMASPVEPAVQAAPATQVTQLEAEQTVDGTLVRVLADGMVGNVVTFTLDDPARLVIDLPELSLASAVSPLEVGSPQVAKVRVGQHSDKLRIVIDAGDGVSPFDGRRVVPASAGLMVALGRGDAIDTALAQATGMPASKPSDSFANAEAAPAASPVPEITEVSPVAEMPTPIESTSSDASVATVYGVEFDSQTNRDRIVVLGDQVLDYVVYEPTPDTFILNLKGSQIDPEAAVRFAPEPGGPVSLVSAFGQPDLEQPEVRVVVNRAANLKPEITRRGSLIVLDFPRQGAVAAAPPVMSEDSVATTAATAPTAADGDYDPMYASANSPNPVAAPASDEPGAAIDVLKEGGLIDGKVYTGRRVSLDFKDVDISDVLRLIAEVSELNVIAGDEVKGKVTIRLVDVPWDQALDVVLLTKGLGFMRIGNVLRIAPATVIAQEEEARLQEKRALEKLEDLVVKLQPVNYADVGQVSGMVGQLLSPRGSVNVDSRTNTLILKDIPSVIDEATALIKAIDTQTPQVLIEAKIVEASLDFSREFGAQWGLGAQPLVDGFDASSGERQDLGGSDLNFHNSANSGFFGNNAVFSNPITANPTGLFNMAAFLLDQKLNLEVQLQAAEVNGDGKVISSPRVVTLDNSEASIEQGVSIPFQTFENGDAQLEFVDAVLKLQVTPHITADKSIIMKIGVNRNAPDTSVFTLTGSPAIAKNQVKTETLVKDGQTLVLGGIYVIEKSQRQSRVPYLHSIPILGAAFRSDEKSESRKELLIFVTPRIVLTPEQDL